MSDALQIVDAELDIFTNAKGKRSILKIEEDLTRIITEIDADIATLQDRAVSQEKAIDAYVYESEIVRLNKEKAGWEEYKEKLPSYLNTSEHRTYKLLIPNFGDYLDFQEKARGKDAPSGPGSIDYSRLMAVMLPKSVGVLDNANPDGWKRLTEAEVRKIEPYVASYLWGLLWEATTPEISQLPG